MEISRCLVFCNDNSDFISVFGVFRAVECNSANSESCGSNPNHLREMSGSSAGRFGLWETPVFDLRIPEEKLIWILAQPVDD